jgi:hypothetical protein
MRIEECLTGRFVHARTDAWRKQRFYELKNGTWIRNKIVSALKRKEFTKLNPHFYLSNKGLEVVHPKGRFKFYTYYECDFYTGYVIQGSFSQRMPATE